MPKKGDILKFKNYYKGEKVPFIIYADTEFLIKSLQTCEPSPQSSYTKKYQKHEPISFLLLQYTPRGFCYFRCPRCI